MSDGTTYCAMEIGTAGFPCPDNDDGWHSCVGDEGHEAWHHCTCGTLWAPPNQWPYPRVDA